MRAYIDTAFLGYMSAAVYYPEETKNLPSLVDIMPPNDGLIPTSQMNLGVVQPPQPPLSHVSSLQPNMSPTAAMGTGNSSPFQYRGPDRCTCKNNQNRIPRPRNAFILFRQKYHQSVLDEGTVCRTNPEVLRELGKRWRQLSTQEKEYWNNLAEEEKVSHAKKYPGYRYTPRRNGKNRSCDYCRLKQIRQQPRSQLYDHLMLLQVLHSPSTHLLTHLLFLGQGLQPLYGNAPTQPVHSQYPVQFTPGQYSGVQQHQFGPVPTPQNLPLGMGMLQIPSQQLGIPMVAPHQGAYGSGNPNFNSVSASSSSSGATGTPVLGTSATPQNQNGQPIQGIVAPYVQYVPFQQPNIQVSSYGDGLTAGNVNEQKLLPLSAPTTEYMDQRYYVPTMDVNYQI